MKFIFIHDKNVNRSKHQDQRGRSKLIRVKNIKFNIANRKNHHVFNRDNKVEQLKYCLQSLCIQFYVHH